ncbi:hypothetical protein, partial [Thiolapillus sp.]|uniref:hypothetical protein n=1 Tax=Thiolapillus sp. TaxID=2017437 RepID=UPI003AF4C615
MEAQHVAVVDGVGDGISVQLLPEDVGGGDHAGRFAFDGAVGGVLGKNGRASVSLPRDRFWDIQFSKIDSPTRQPLLPRPSCVRAASPHLR